MADSTEADQNSEQPSPGSNTYRRYVAPTRTQIVIWSLLPAALVDVAVTTTLFLVGEGALSLVRDYSTSVLLVPILHIAGETSSAFSLVQAFLPLWLIASIVCILVRLTIDILRPAQPQLRSS